MPLVPFAVSASHIALGAPGVACSCPVAIALANILGAEHSVRVWPEYVEIDGKPHPAGADLRAWIRAYDASGKAEPAAFVVDTDAVYDRANRFAGGALAGSCLGKAAA